MWTGSGSNGVTKGVGISSVDSGAVLFLTLLFSQSKPSIFQSVDKQSHRAPRVYLIEEEADVNPSNRLRSLRKVEE